MRLAISLRDQSFVHTQSLGILKVSLGLARALAGHPGVASLTVITNASLGACVGAESTRLRYAGLREPAPRGPARVRWDQWGVARAVARGEADWLILPKGFPPIAARPPQRLCCYVHDDIAWRAPDARPSLRGALSRAYFGAAYLRALRSADVIVTNSAFTAACVRGRLRGAQPVVPVGVGFDHSGPHAMPRTRANGPILVLTSPHPHKRTPQAIAWLTRWADAQPKPVSVVGVGGLPVGVRWPERPGFHHYPRLDQARYDALSSLAAVLVYFSSYEGYGMPPREALADGRWTLASDLPALREEVPAELLFDNASYADFATRLDAVWAGARGGVAPPRLTLPSFDEVAARLLEALNAHDRARP